jgi:hypothetical protein
MVSPSVCSLVNLRWKIQLLFLIIFNEAAFITMERSFLIRLLPLTNSLRQKSFQTLIIILFVHLHSAAKRCCHLVECHDSNTNVHSYFKALKLLLSSHPPSSTLGLLPRPIPNVCLLSSSWRTQSTYVRIVALRCSQRRITELLLMITFLRTCFVRRL